ncbi:thiopeptide-type bacteriocin biosynthesis protein [Streptomyces sp. NPDC046900]|uniref:thiopeptide-type bacteriocin biosynthesis protein n=1 Tax=Streptomyces sp. NPDC046900 TaxID=3155473 RepID=UPI0033D051B4
MSTWSSLHVHAHGDRDYKDELLLDCLAPAADLMVAEGAASGWFFIRYWAGSPHVRIRLRDADPQRVRQLADQARTWLAAHPLDAEPLDPEAFYATVGGRAALESYTWHPHGSVVPGVYEPESERYGGQFAMADAEELFIVSTQVALAAIRSSRQGGQRLGVALNLLTAFASAVCPSSAVEVTMLRRYVYSSRFNTVDAPRVDLTALRERAEADYAAGRERYLAAAAKVRGVLARGGTGRGYPGLWADRAGDYAERLAALEAEGRLTGLGSRWTVLLSQVHMLNNRLGVELAEEYHLAWLTSLVAARSSMGEGFHTRGLETPARRLHEESKYFAVSIRNQVPLRAERTEPRGDGGRVVELPPPAEDSLVRPGLVDCLAARRSTLENIGGKVGVPALSALLGFAAGQRRIEVPTVSGEPMSVAVRPHPSAGATLPTRILVLPRRVPTVEPALYEYLADRHALRTIAPAPTDDELARSSPYFDQAQGVAMDAASVPLWLFVVGGLSAITERYGMRAYRFLLLEAGHLAQNLLLTATALGQRSTVLGAFYDDALSQLLELDGVNSAPFYAIPVGA